MIDFFEDYSLQREELLARIAQELQLDKTRKERMETAYKSVARNLEKAPFFKDIDIDVYAQGSMRIGTTVKPINKDDFDLDIVLHLLDQYNNFRPQGLYNSLVNALEDNSYYNSIMEKKNRCIRLNYKNDFHMDILPACMPNYTEKEEVYIPEKSLDSWSSGNPKGFSKWFLKKSDLATNFLLKQSSESLIKAQMDTEPLPKELYLKTPLQRAVQLIKRRRDIYFQNRKYSVSSIVLTTLAGQLYEGESSIYETLDKILEKIDKYNWNVINDKTIFKVLNPVNPEENFTDSWEPDHYKSFQEFISDFYKKWKNLKESFKKGKEDYIELFGEGIYKIALQGQLKAFSNSDRKSLDQSSGLLVGGKAYMDGKGNFNSKKGVKNESHHSFGGRY